MEIDRTRLSETSEDQNIQDFNLDTQAEQYRQVYDQIERNITIDSTSYEKLDFNRFTVHLNLEDKGSIYTIACQQLNQLEPFELSLFGELICRNPDSTVIDVGA